MLPPEGFSYGLPHHTPPSHPREPREAARTSPKIKKKTFSHLLHTASTTLPLPKMKCGGHRKKEWVQSTAGEDRGLFSIPWRGQRFIFHPFPRQQTLHCSCLLPVSALPLFAPCSCTLSVCRDPGQVLQPRTLCQGLVVPPQSPARCEPAQAVSPSCPQSWQQPQQDTRLGDSREPAECHEPALAAAVGQRGSLCPR